MHFKTWGEAYFSFLARGYDNGYAAYLADKWEERQRPK